MPFDLFFYKALFDIFTGCMNATNAIPSDKSA